MSRLNASGLSRRERSLQGLRSTSLGKEVSSGAWNEWAGEMRVGGNYSKAKVSPTPRRFIPARSALHPSTCPSSVPHPFGI